MITIYKQIGETPLQALDRLRKEKPEFAGATLSYIGRLDPMAEGLLLVLVGEENKERGKYLDLDKKYEFEILFGFETDTYDLLGIASLGENKLMRDSRSRAGESERIFQQKNDACPKEFSFLSNLLGKINQSYPPFSSKPVNGKPLWQWARMGKLDEIEIPTHEIEIYSLDFIGQREISKEDLIKTIEENVMKVTGDFRQKEIIESWKGAIESVSKGKEANFALAKFAVHCSTGTYVRQLAQEIGKRIDQKATIFSLKRTEIVLDSRKKEV